MHCEIVNYTDQWQMIKDSALFTIHKENGKYPTSKWKRDILIAEHSPIRSGRLIINIYDIPSFVVTHLIRHHIGIEKFVATFRSDRFDSETVPDRNTLQNMRIDVNFQALISISRKRCCNGASKETIVVWNMILSEIAKYEPELYSVCVRECIYRGFCSEMYQCKQKYSESNDYKIKLSAYRNKAN